MRLITTIAVSAALLACLAAMPAARAQTTLTLTPAAQAGSPGGAPFFSGTLANTGTSDVFLNGDSLTFNGPSGGLTLGDSPFLANAPATLAPGGTFTGGLFDVSLGASAAPGTYFGTFAVTGGADGNAQDTLASEDFSVTVEPASASAAPEPSQTAGLASRPSAQPACSCGPGGARRLRPCDTTPRTWKGPAHNAPGLLFRV